MKNTYSIFWYHTSKVTPQGDKPKVKFFDDEEKAEKFYETLSKRIHYEQSYQQGVVSHLCKNF